MNSETEDQVRLRKAKDVVAAYQSSEAEARMALAAAVESTKRARERYNELLLTEEKREYARRALS